MSAMRQSSQVRYRLPPWSVALLAVVSGPVPVVAQQNYRVTRTENFRRTPEPSAVRLATVNAGTEMAGDSTAGRWVRVALEGWVWGASTAPTAQDGFELQLSQSQGENLREVPNGPIVARLENGCLLEVISRDAPWIQVRRVGWMFDGSLERVGGSSGASGESGEAETSPSPASYDTVTVGLDLAAAAPDAVLRNRPEGDSVGVLADGASLRVLARSGEWVRVMAEGWVRSQDLLPTVPDILVGVSGAEVRARPSDYVGRLLRWRVNFIAIQRADELRPEIPSGERYALVRGPLPENGFIYLVVNDEQLSALEELPALTELEIVGRVRVGRSQYVGNPILTLVDFARPDS